MTENEQRKLFAELVRDLFLRVRALMPPSEQNTRRQTEFAARLQAYIETLKETEN
jgi:hypothetical protein